MLSIILQIINVLLKNISLTITVLLHILLFCYNISSIQEPKSFKEAIKHNCWKEVLQRELYAFESNETWSLVDFPPRNNFIGYKWIL